MVASYFGWKSLLETNKTNHFLLNPSFLIFRLTLTKLNKPLNNQFLSWTLILPKHVLYLTNIIQKKTSIWITSSFSKQLGRVRSMVASDFGLKSLLETNKTKKFSINPSFLIFRLTSTKLNKPLNNKFLSWTSILPRHVLYLTNIIQTKLAFE